MKNATLLNHRGSKKIDRQTLSKIATPAATKSWCPVGHSELLDLVGQKAEEHGFKVTEGEHAVSKLGRRYFGVLELQRSNGPKSGDYTLCVGLRNSIDRSLSAGLVSGTKVFVCDNMAFSGEVSIFRQHRRYIKDHLPQMVSDAITFIDDKLFVKEQKRVEAYKSSELADSRVHDLLIKTMDDHVISASDIPMVLKEWRSPRHPEFVKSGPSAWRLFNAYTETLKSVNFIDLPRRTQILHSTFDKLCGIGEN